MNKTKIILVLLSLLASPCASAASEMAGATFPEQIVQEATAAQQAATQAQQLIQQIQSYENMVQNMVTIPQQLAGQIMQPVDSLMGLVGEAQGLAQNGQNLAQQFSNMNVSFSPTATTQFLNGYSSAQSNLNATINNALQTANLNPSNFATMAQAQQAVQSAMSNPQSRNAILQASVEVGNASLSSLNQIASTANSECTMEASYRKMQQANKQAGSTALTNLVFGSQG